jgi:hypothetical protein
METRRARIYIKRSVPQGDKTMRSARRWAFLLALLSLFAAHAEDKSKPVTISLDNFGIPKSLFAVVRPLTCFHEHAAGTRMFWLDANHIFVAFTTNAPCTVKTESEAPNLRAIVFSSTGAKIASRDWPLHDDLTVFAGPNRTIVLWRGRKLELLDDHLETIDSGELSESPRGLYVTPARRTIPLLTADGRNFEFYGTDPLKMISTIAIDQSTEANAVKEWVPGDERVAGVRCSDKSNFSCTKILVLTPDANFIAPDGAPWSYEETGKPVSLNAVGFIDSTHLLISREDRNFFHSPQNFIVRPDGSKMQLPSPGGQFYVHRIAGIADGGSRFALEYVAPGMCDECIASRRFVVEEVDSKKFLFDKFGSPYFSRFELSPDGKSVAVFDNRAIIIYPLP